MYYEEKVINGILCSRTTPNGEWKQFTLVDLTNEYLEMKGLYERERKTNNELHKTTRLILDLLNEATK